MKYLKLFEDYRFNNILYHGTDNKHRFNDRGYITDGTFFAEDINVAKGYGRYVYRVEIKNIPIFDSLNLKDVTELFNEFGELYDSYYGDGDGEYYIRTPEQLMNHSDNWGIIENTDRVLDWKRGEYRGVRIIEGGSESNILLFYPKEDIISYNLI